LKESGRLTVPEENPLDELAALIKRVRAKDASAEAEVHARFRRFVERRLAEARSRRNWFWLEELDDAVQEVFIHFFQAVRDGKFVFEGEDRLEGFLVRTCWFVAMNAKDKVPRARTVSLFKAADDEEGGLILDLPAFAKGASERLHGRECAELLYKTIAELGEARREVLLRTLQGEKVRDIVKATGKTASSVSGLKFNAMKELREKLEANGFVRDCGAEAFQ
jgi:RNA polymerase sigma factor (sigma-70 family)